MVSRATTMTNTVSPQRKTGWSGVLISHENNLKTGGVVIGRNGGSFVLEEPVGSGGSGMIWRAHASDAPTDVVAVKIVKFDPRLGNARHRFAREIAMCEHLTGPNFALTHDYGMEATFGFIVMDLLEGEDLYIRLKARGRFSIPELTPVVVGVGKALAHAHREGLIHRDIKPRNIFFSKHSKAGEVVKVLDFGIAKLVADSAKLTNMEGRLGSAHYMSPEQISAPASVDHRTDVFSFGSVLYRSLTGRLPFPGDAASVLRSILVEPAAPPSVLVPGLPPAVDEFFERALAKKREDRFSDIDAMVAAYLQAIRDPSAPYIPVSLEDPPPEEPSSSEEPAEDQSPTRAPNEAPIPAPTEAREEPPPPAFPHSDSPPRVESPPATRWWIVGIFFLVLALGAFVLAQSGLLSR